MLVVNQLIGKYECKDDILRLYHEECLRLLKEFKKVTIEHVPKFYNSDANRRLSMLQDIGRWKK